MPSPISQNPELLAPAGGWEPLRAAVANGADAVYFGLPRFNARLRADNFRDDELPTVVEFCHRHGVRAYVAFNTLVFTNELEAAERMLRDCSRAGVDALIVQDLGLVRLARATVPHLPLHASTQMTITSPEGVAFARELGLARVVLARELSLRELEKFGDPAESALPLEVFVHGALCVAYSGQCLTSEALGQRSANRGECAQACRMPYELLVDGVLQDLGDKRYLLSPQDLAAAREIPQLLARGITSFKIEGRLKSAEYVAAVCQVYRRALDAALASQPHEPSAADDYQLEMTFSRGLFSGWLHGVDHQQLVSARFGKKRGPLAGKVLRVLRDCVELEEQLALQPGDGVVFDAGANPDDEQGGRIYEIRGGRLYFEHGKINFTQVHPGDRVWKTDDPGLNKKLRQTYAGQLAPRRRELLALQVRGRAGSPMEISVEQGPDLTVLSTILLQTARTAPLTTERLREHLGRFGDQPYALGTLDNALEGDVILPIGEVNRLRRELAFRLQSRTAEPRPENPVPWRSLLGPDQQPASGDPGGDLPPATPANLSVLVRTFAQLEAAADAKVPLIYADFEDIRRGADAVARWRSLAGGSIFLATPRIQKAGEQGFFKHLEQAQPDGVLLRNLGAVRYFQNSPLQRIGDFSLNVANPLTAQHCLAQGLTRVAICYDLNIEQVLDLLHAAPPSWFELTLHQHVPMFHMEHCVFAAFLSKGTSFLDCGRPCEKHRVHLKDRVGMEHPLRADVGCRNTLFNAVPQTGARFYAELRAAGLAHFRIELLEEDRDQSLRTIRIYQALLSGTSRGEDLWHELKAHSQLGVTRGTLAQKPTISSLAALRVD